MPRCWRINPSEAIDYTVEQLARRESRSTSNMLMVLLKEAIEARRQVQAHAHLASVIRGKSDTGTAT
jgi:hypothetical protein